LLKQAQHILEEMIEWRRDFHMHPELSFNEVRTAKKVSEALTEMGIPHQTQVGITGVVAHIGEGKPVVGIRGDMDALPINEANDVPYASQNEGVMHACGHDSHTAMLLGVAKILSEKEDRPPGEIRLFFQPSEEAWDEELKSGATRMIEDGALEGVDAVIALHVNSISPAGLIKVRAGYASAAVDDFHATIKGKGGHGAYPHYTIDPTFILAQVINAIHGIRARQVDPTKASVISIGSIQAGDATNVIPPEVKLSGTIRSFDEDVRAQLAKDLEAALAVSRSFGGDYELEIENGYPAMYNDPEVTELIRQTAIEIAGEEHVEEAEAQMGAEDFSYMTQAAPGMMFNLGAQLDEVYRGHHSPTFDLDENVMPLGAAIMAEAACRLLKEKSK
jgi:amidohydrolase